MLSDELYIFWTREFGDNLPVADELKWKFDERWFRIHTLPDSKRYAANESEYDEIFFRHNQILDDLFDSTNDLILVSCTYSEDNKPTKDSKLEAIGFQENIWRSLSNEEESYKYYRHLFFDERLWKVGSLNPLLRLVANDEVNEIMIISAEKNFVYHPYDGGADVILKDGQTRDNCKKKYEEWLPDRPDGL